MLNTLDSGLAANSTEALDNNFSNFLVWFWGIPFWAKFGFLLFSFIILAFLLKLIIKYFPTHQECFCQNEV